MNKIVRENYPASKLPEELRPTASPTARVTVVIEADEPSPPKSLSEVRHEIEEAKRLGKWPATTADEAVARVRALRDEWHD
jgi:hypothetical protein